MPSSCFEQIDGQTGRQAGRRTDKMTLKSQHHHNTMMLVEGFVIVDGHCLDHVTEAGNMPYRTHGACLIWHLVIR